MTLSTPPRHLSIALAPLALALAAGSACRRAQPAPPPTSAPAPLLGGKFVPPALPPAPTAPPSDPGEVADGPIPPDCEDYVQMRMDHWENKRADYEESGVPFAVPSPDLERLRQGWRQAMARDGARSAASRCRSELFKLAQQL